MEQFTGLGHTAVYRSASMLGSSRIKVVIWWFRDFLTFNLVYLTLGVGNYVHTKGRIWKIFEAEGRTSADVQFSNKIQANSKKKSHHVRTVA